MNIDTVQIGETYVLDYYRTAATRLKVDAIVTRDEGTRSHPRNVRQVQGTVVAVGQAYGRRAPEIGATYVCPARYLGPTAAVRDAQLAERRAEQVIYDDAIKALAKVGLSGRRQGYTVQVQLDPEQAHQLAERLTP